MTLRLAVVCLAACLVPLQGFAQPPLKVYLDCDFCFEDFIRDEVDLAEYVRDPREADVHVIVTSAETASGGRERAIALIGLGRFKGLEFKLRALSESGDTEDTQRQRLATAITIGLLNYLSSEGVAGGLSIDVERAARAGPAGALVDRWHHWVVSLQGSVSTSGEESSRTLDLNGDIGADHISDRWKITMGFEVEYRREDFDLDEDDPLRAIRRQRDFDMLVARSLPEHWSVGARASLDASSFDNIALRGFGGPAVEYNVFPYSEYTRRQLRIGYAIGPYAARYVEETLFFTTSDRLVRQQASVAIDQREPWGSLEGELEYSSFLPEPSRYRLQLEADVNVRIARGLSLAIEGTTSRIRDQIFILRRGVTPEEVLLRLRRLRSGYDYSVQIGLTYTFGSIFNTLVNPRFGR